MKYRLYSRSTYFQDLILQINGSRPDDRICIATMGFDPNVELVDGIISALCNAAKRGVIVNLIVDAYPFLIKKAAVPGPLFFQKSLPKKFISRTFRQRFEALDRLQTSGGNYTIVNLPRRRFLNPFACRSHIKFAIVNNLVWIGGCNLTNAHHDDLMVGWQDKETANWLYKNAQKIIFSKSVKTALDGHDTQLKIDEHSRLIIDSGVPRQSTIMDLGLSIIATAKQRILLTSQFEPNGIVARKMSKAINDGVDITMYYNHPAKHPFPTNLLHHAVLASHRTTNNPALFSKQRNKRLPFLHAKILLNEKQLLVGSHNYAQIGVKFGTAEIALYSSDPRLLDQVNQFVEDKFVH